MLWSHGTATDSKMSDSEAERAEAEAALHADNRRRAVRVVAACAASTEEFRELAGMLGISARSRPPAARDRASAAAAAPLRDVSPAPSRTALSGSRRESGPAVGSPGRRRRGRSARLLRAISPSPNNASRYTTLDVPTVRAASPAVTTTGKRSSARYRHDVSTTRPTAGSSRMSTPDASMSQAFTAVSNIR